MDEIKEAKEEKLGNSSRRTNPGVNRNQSKKEKEGTNSRQKFPKVARVPVPPSTSLFKPNYSRDSRVLSHFRSKYSRYW